MSQNKTIVPGVDFENINKDAATDSFYESFYTRSSNQDNHTIIGNGELINQQNDPLSPSFCAQSTKPQVLENSRFIKIRERVVVGVMFSISKGLLGEIFPIYLGKNIIGKNENCDIVLSEKTISDQHGILHTRKSGDGIAASITDFNSMYGTIVNDMDARYETLQLHENDIITFGRHYRFILKFFETEKYNLEEDEEFEVPNAIQISTGSKASGNDAGNADGDFYSPSSRVNDSSRTVIY